MNIGKNTDVIILSPDDFENICRTCLSQVQLEQIYFDDTEFSIVKMLMAIADVQISDRDNLPTKICTSCIKALNLAFRFKQQCEEAEYKLKEFLNAYKIINQEGDVSTVVEDKTFSTYLLVDQFEDTNDLIFPHITDTNVDSFRDVYEDEKNENSCQEIIKDCGDIQIKTTNESYKQNPKKVMEKKLEKSFHCEVCNKKFSFRSNFRRHVQLHTEKPKYVKKPVILKACPTCGKLIKSDSLVYHIKLHSAEKFQCEICCYKFSIRSNYIRHLKIHTGEKSNICEICGKGFIQTYSLREHMRIHTQERPYKCNLCGKSFIQKSLLNKHLKKVHNYKISIENNKQFTCLVCNEIFTSSKALNGHSKVHIIKPFNCDKCKRLFTTQIDLNMHNCNGESICKICDKSSLCLHKSYLCDFCGKNCASSLTLKAHLQIHSEERPFKCKFCIKTFKTNAVLKIHLVQHTGERKFSCTRCDKTFNQSTHLRQHMRVHTGEKPYNCVICNKNFASKINYIVHTRIHSGERPYVCKICNKGFHHSTAKKKHEKTHIKNQNEVQ